MESSRSAPIRNPPATSCGTSIRAPAGNRSGGSKGRDAAPSASGKSKTAGSASQPYLRNRHERKETERFKAFGYDELAKRDKANLDIFWLKDDALEESANLPAPEVIAADIAADLAAALEQFNTIAEDLK